MGFTKAKRSQDAGSLLSGPLDRLSITDAQKTPDAKSRLCQLCDRLTVFLDQNQPDSKSVLSYHQKFAIFHNRSCSTCQPTPTGPFCAFCAHLRLGHLVRCSQAFQKITVCVPQDIRFQKDCHFCLYMLSCRPSRCFEPRGNFELLRGNLGWPTNAKVGAVILDSDDFSCIDFLRIIRTPKATKSQVDGLGKLNFSIEHEPQTTIFTENLDVPACIEPQNGQDWAAIKKQFAECASMHTSCSQRRFFLEHRHFRVIDIRNMCLVAANLDCGFAALSYVWGSGKFSKKLKASVSNISRLMRPGSILPDELPNTITDAILVCMKLGIRYLWVDRICIIQDSEEDISSQIQSMGNVFSSANIVIAALVNDMDCGIPGISSPRTYDMVNMDGLKIVKNIFTERWHLMSEQIMSIWSTRGWTYQESALARRILYLGKGLAWFWCSRSGTLENFNSLNLTDLNYLFPYSKVDYDSKLSSWFRHLACYSKKSLSVPTDIYNAFTGISDAIYDFHPNSLYYGLPREDFENALALYPWLHTRARERPRSAPRSFQLPSWSWAVFEGLVARSGDGSACRPLVTWAGNKTTDEKAFGCIQDRRPGRSALESAWIQDLITHDSLSKAIRQIEIPSRFEKPDQIWDFMLKALPKEDFAASGAGEFPQDLIADFPLRRDSMSLLKPGTLLGRVQTTTFRTGPASEHLYSPFLSSDGQTVGCLVCRSPYFESDLQPRLQYQGAVELVAILADQQNLNKLCGLRQNMFTHLTALGPKEQAKEVNRILSDRSLDLTFYDRNGNPLPTVPVIHVMAIGWRGPIAIKIGIGWVLLTAWLKAKRQIRTILLE